MRLRTESNSSKNSQERKPEFV